MRRRNEYGNYSIESYAMDFPFIGYLKKKSAQNKNALNNSLQYMWVMPSSSARCAQLPRAADKVPFYVALKKFRDYLNGVIPHIDDSECVFADPKTKSCYGQ